MKAYTLSEFIERFKIMGNCKHKFLIVDGRLTKVSLECALEANIGLIHYMVSEWV